MSSQKKFTNDDTMIDEDDNVDNKDHVMEDITREFSMSIVNKTTVSSKTVEKLRKIYLKKIKTGTWKTFFENFGKDLMSKLNELENKDNEDENKQLYDTPYSISTGGKPDELAKTTITIGRRTECDINICGNAISRLCAIVFIQPSRVIVIDPGNFAGIKTKKKENKEK
uniref:Forkhead associated (FHA) domain and RING domain protein n=1 Tax=Mimivirus LCMiAC02 TaxID=2506609 RepID=A0A481Z2C7_9VIRU|nr:MAG: forkhead associated (FHA) domain and RING domain protein [Mimivirus LCMiAC02]